MLRPALAGMALDLLDLITMGPIGLWTGMIVGTAFGYVLAPTLGFSAKRRWLCALLAGIYCTLPTTGFVPLATVLTVAARMVGGRSDQRGSDDDDDSGDGGDVIEVDFAKRDAGGDGPGDTHA